MTTRVDAISPAAPLPSPDLSVAVPAPPRSRTRWRWDRIGVLMFGLALAAIFYGGLAWLLTGGWRVVAHAFTHVL